MNFHEETANAIDSAINSKLNFCAYRFPNDKDIHFHASDTLDTHPSPGAFLVAPFEPTTDNIRFIPLKLNARETIIAAAKSGIQGLSVSENDDTTSRSDYMLGIAPILSHLRINGGKIVYSRVTSGDADFSVSELFFLLCKEYPNAFVHIYKADEEIWAGATPELLLESNGETLQTVALAGTRPAGTSGEWDAKNIEEQEMVTGFICETLRKAGVRPDISQPHTHNAGPVEHICTRIKATFPENMGMIELLCNLAPTPAVSGFPRETALQMISTHEKHRRRHYGGTIGVYESAKRFRLFVNLRSMRISSGRYAIYTGGGITSKSDPEKEWVETCIKASTLLSVISKYKH